MSTHDTPEAALATALREAEDADEAEGHGPTCHEPWENRIAAASLAALDPEWTLVPTGSAAAYLAKSFGEVAVQRDRMTDLWSKQQATIARLRKIKEAARTISDRIAEDDVIDGEEWEPMLLALRAALAEGDER